MSNKTKSSSNVSVNGNLILYYYPISYYSQKVLFALFEKQIPFQSRLVNIQSGQQYKEDFLNLNPKAEVPVLVDDIRVIPDSNQIIDYLESNFSAAASLYPKDPHQKLRSDELTADILNLNIEALTSGSMIFKDLDIEPKEYYRQPKNQNKLKETISRRIPEISQMAQNHPKYKSNLEQKLEDAINSNMLIENREAFESVLLTIEKVLDKCEAELVSHDDKSLWLCSPDLSVADINLGILLHRLYLLGHEKRMWENRPHIALYYKQMAKLSSFKKATSMALPGKISEIIKNPWTWGILGTCGILFGVVYYAKLKGMTPADIWLILAKGQDNDLSSYQISSGAVRLPEEVQNQFLSHPLNTPI